jgi:hypothetical protein
MNEIETQIDFRQKPDPAGDFEYNLSARKRNATGWQIAFLGATVICVVLLMTLLIKVVNDAFGYVAMQNKIQPAALLAQYAPDAAPGMSLPDLPKETLTQIFKDNVSAGLYRRYDREKKFDERTPEEVRMPWCRSAWSNPRLATGASSNRSSIGVTLRRKSPPFPTARWSSAAGSTRT